MQPRALDSAPDYAKFYQSWRAFIRVSLDQTEGLKDDLRRYELLGRFLTRGFFRYSSRPRRGQLPYRPWCQPHSGPWILTSIQASRLNRATRWWNPK